MTNVWLVEQFEEGSSDVYSTMWDSESKALREVRRIANMCLDGYDLRVWNDEYLVVVNAKTRTTLAEMKRYDVL